MIGHFVNRKQYGTMNVSHVLLLAVIAFAFGYANSSAGAKMAHKLVRTVNTVKFEFMRNVNVIF